VGCFKVLSRQFPGVRPAGFGQDSNPISHEHVTSVPIMFLVAKGHTERDDDDDKDKARDKYINNRMVMM